MATTGEERPRVARGSLSQERIVAATLELIRTEPDEAITMERVATAVGAGPMSLYTHVRSRDELLALTAAEALREWDAEVPSAAPWDEQLRAWCRSLRDHVQAHRPLLLEMTTQGSFQPALLAAVATLSRILRAAGLDGRAHAEALRWVPQTVLGTVVLEQDRPPELRGAEQEGVAISGSLAELAPEDRAELEDVLPWFASPELGDLFEYSLERLVDGVRSAVDHSGAMPR